MLNDFRFAIRRLRKNSFEVGAGLVAFLLGVGINTTMFSVSDAILFRPVELAQASRLVVFEQFTNGETNGLNNASPADARDLARDMKSLDASGYLRRWNTTITKDGEPEQLDVGETTANWMDLIGASLVQGRSFRPKEDQPGTPKVVILTHGLWKRRYGADPKVLGRQIRLDDQPFEVIGVLKETSRFPSNVQAFVPLQVKPSYWEDHSSLDLMIVGHLKPGISTTEAQAEANTLMAGLIRQYPRTHTGRSFLTAPLLERVTSTNDRSGSYTRMMLIATAFVLLIACANVANLQLARISARGRDYAIQNALGAGKWRIARQVLVECVVLSLTGALLGALASQWLTLTLRNELPAQIWQYLPMWPYMELNQRALAVAIGLSVIAGIVSGIAPALHGIKANAQEALREGGRSMSSSRGRHWFRNGLVALQMVLAIVLLVGAGLMVRGSHTVLDRFAARHPEEVATARISLPGLKYADPSRRQDFSRRLEAALSRIPSKSAASLVINVPMTDYLWTDPAVVEGKPEPDPALRPSVVNQSVAANYFSLLRIPLRQGRFLDATDQAGREPVCVIDELFAARLFPGENPLGHRVSPAGDATRKYCKIVGIVAPEFASAWDREPRPTLYRPLQQTAPYSFCALLRGPAHQMPALLAGIRAAVHEVDPDLPVTDALSHRELMDNALSGLRMVAILMTVVGAIALILACVGVYSVMAFTVNERTSEIGMRMAMGALPSDILRELTRQTLQVCSIGIAFGLAAGYAVARLFGGLLFGVSANDFFSLASVSLLLAAVAALAMYIPARRAMRMDPLAALRHD